MLQEILIAGFGGQGVLSTGQLMAYAGMIEGKQVAWIPSYGPEMRGGTANCGITISDEPISSPLVTEPTTLIVMNRPSLDKFEKAVVPGGLILINSSLVEQKVKREDVKAIEIPANKIAEELGNVRVANNVILGALIELTGIVTVEAVVESLKKVLPARRHNMIPVNQLALESGIKLAKELK
ncbi:2-oxoacid:acceptor oxidoreductase family protein [Desulforamulus aquiferis]|uniref:2-oxoacid:acceptor oxidoreductase family protein n=1 Tax=Desulforamulus aquiferis TaxID=1397668 RepID=A0AAW7ZCA2_9FIRM|nr:2-oxoacid:acceptor oxidoreductase family protein [Desulforamulus aquiferis]MDO7786420.1 2-oxoacid:acceptor oxidoreductase family protein [Desulforamulus aquiferis]RYD02522.1 2-oxoglutarate ferredoxin oxidoreductase subunit gamma [Desulforamulus aquiferis]